MTIAKFSEKMIGPSAECFPTAGHGHDKGVPVKLESVGEVIAARTLKLLTNQGTLSTLGVELEVLNKELGGGLSWEFSESGTFGFPDMPPATL
jgi:hypothetical protein